ncbi:phosphoglycolate phosphatase [Alsobacter sp. SYSU M60028]|uniref:Phosphoglycolate phosphatase n=1 Tax=Alsobacter ponti TaxID=2962936 RepID=A0ABT1LJ41_9HYPH|nr:phosphoglycolate phosphatase [Alsobacter ponti]MCP8940913.1 phosphoglycolate phosphatase [Alsobacter ponti]
MARANDPGAMDAVGPLAERRPRTPGIAVRAVVFDLDGTLVDSARDLLEAANATLGERGLRKLSLDEARGMIGDGVARLVERALAATGGDAADLPRAVERFMAIYTRDAVRFTRPYPGVTETLRELAGRGLRLAVVTNKPRAVTLHILESLGLAPLFEAVVGGDSAPRRKPHPDPLLAALAAMGVAPGDALMVGDNFHDVEAAHAAGLAAVVVTYGYSHRPHGELGADALIDAMLELPGLLLPAARA